MAIQRAKVPVMIGYQVPAQTHLNYQSNYKVQYMHITHNECH